MVRPILSRYKLKWTDSINGIKSQSFFGPRRAPSWREFYLGCCEYKQRRGKDTADARVSWPEHRFGHKNIAAGIYDSGVLLNDLSFQLRGKAHKRMGAQSAKHQRRRSTRRMSHPYTWH
jgi:hypothetical protein